MRSLNLACDLASDNAERIFNQCKHLKSASFYSLNDSSTYIGTGVQVSSPSLEVLNLARLYEEEFCIYFGDCPKLSEVHLLHGKFKVVFGFCCATTFSCLTEITFATVVDTLYVISHISQFINYLPNLKRLGFEYLNELQVHQIFGYPSFMHIVMFHDFDIAKEVRVSSFMDNWQRVFFLTSEGT